MKKQTLWLVLTAVLVLAAALYPLRVLRIEEPRRGKVLYLRTVKPGDRFSLSYLHSVELSRVSDGLRVDGRYRLVLEETRFGSSNTGLPSVLEAGERYSRGELDSRISNMQRLLPAIEIWVGRDYENTLAFDDGKILLPDLAGDTLLWIGIRETTLFQWFCTKTTTLIGRATRR